MEMSKSANNSKNIVECIEKACETDKHLSQIYVY